MARYSSREEGAGRVENKEEYREEAVSPGGEWPAEDERYLSTRDWPSHSATAAVVAVREGELA